MAGTGDEAVKCHRPVHDHLAAHVMTAVLGTLTTRLATSEPTPAKISARTVKVQIFTPIGAFGKCRYATPWEPDDPFGLRDRSVVPAPRHIVPTTPPDLPDQVTHVWLMAFWTMGSGLRWSPNGGGSGEDYDRGRALVEEAAR
jgi:hypothetical protein